MIPNFGKLMLLESSIFHSTFHRKYPVSFRSGLGNSLYCDPLRIGSFSQEQVCFKMMGSFIKYALKIFVETSICNTLIHT